MHPLTIVQHEPDGPPGSIAAALDEFQVPYVVRHVYQGDALPAWPDESSGLISLGGAMHVTQTRQHPFLADEVKLMRRMVHEGAPVWGISLGAQLLVVASGGDVYRRRHPVLGWMEVEKEYDDPLLHGVPSPFIAFTWRAYSIRPSPTSRLVARSDDSVQAFRAGGRAWGTQFHPHIDAAMAPHWVEDAIKEHKHVGEEFGDRLRVDTERHLPAYPAFCRRLTENFLSMSGLLER